MSFEVERDRTGIRREVEAEVLWGRRAFPKAQQLLAGEAMGSVGRLTIGWHHTEAHPERGAFAVVRRGGPLTDLLGEVLIVSYGYRQVFLYCVNSAVVPTDLSITRRAMLALTRLTRETIPVDVQVRV